MNSQPSYFVVVDLEATCDDRGAVPREQSEIIEIGAVLVDSTTLQPIDELQTFVRPIVCPVLTPFCTELTTITQADVADAPLFPEAAERLTAFARGGLFCSWGAYDRNQLERDARRHRVPCPLGPEHYNLKALFARAYRLWRPIGNRGALEHVGLAAIGTYHRGIDDARNIARLLPHALRGLA